MSEPRRWEVNHNTHSIALGMGSSLPGRSRAGRKPAVNKGNRKSQDLSAQSPGPSLSGVGLNRRSNSSPGSSAGSFQFKEDEDAHETKFDDKDQSPFKSSFSDDEIEEGLQVLYAKGVRMIAWDFDLTAYGKHTGGGVPFNSTLPEIIKFMSPVFVKSVPKAQSLGIRCCIVTFSDDSDDNTLGGEVFIVAVLNACFKKKETWNRILVAAANPDMHYLPSESAEEASKNSPSKHQLTHKCEDSECYCMRYMEPFHVSQCIGKEWHLSKVMDEHRQRTGVTLEPRQVLLIDDSSQNILKARKDGFKVFEVPALRNKAGGMTIEAWRSMVRFFESSI